MESRVKIREVIRCILSECINEDAAQDIKFNNEARRVYNKILKNIQTIKLAPTPNEDEKDFVRDTNGNIHILDGVKFNLKQLGLKYDLDILFVHTIGRYTNHHYDQNANRIVFFIISQSKPLDFENNSYVARLRFHSWVEERIFVHEFVHFLDANRYKDTYSFSTPQDRGTYFNSPEEYNSYTQEIIGQILKNKNKLRGLSFDVFLRKSLKFAHDDFLKNLDDGYKKKLANRLYKIYGQINQSSAE
jgi:hypothetical protein